MNKAYSIIWWLHESDPDWTESYFHEHPISFPDPFSAKIEAEKLAWLEFDRIRENWYSPPAEVSYLSKPVEKKESNPQLQRPHRIRHRIKLNAWLSPNGDPNGLTYTWYECEVVEFDA